MGGCVAAMTDPASAGPIGRSSVARVGIATALTAFCGYGVVAEHLFPQIASASIATGHEGRTPQVILVVADVAQGVHAS